MDSPVHGATSYLPEDLAMLIRGYRLVQVPLLGWDVSLCSGTGSVTSSPVQLQVNTGLTAASVGLAFVGSRGLAPGDLYNRVDFDRKLLIIAEICRAGSDTGCIHRLHLKSAQTAANLAAVGIGIKILNNAFNGEGYGSANGLVDLYTTRSANSVARIAIVHYPGQRIEWYADGALAGVQTDTTKIPSGIVNSMNISFSTINPGAGGVDCMAILTNLMIGQE